MLNKKNILPKIYTLIRSLNDELKIYPNKQNIKLVNNIFDIKLLTHISIKLTSIWNTLKWLNTGAYCYEWTWSCACMYLNMCSFMRTMAVPWEHTRTNANRTQIHALPFIRQFSLIDVSQLIDSLAMFTSRPVSMVKFWSYICKCKQFKGFI